MLVRDAVAHPATKLAVGAVTVSNPWWLEYISQVSPLISFLALVAGAVYMCLQIAHLLKHWHSPRR